MTTTTPAPADTGTDTDLIAPSTRGDTFRADRVRWVFTSSDLRDLGTAIAHAEEVVVDLETTGLDPYATGPVPARIVCAAFTLPPQPAHGTQRSLDLPTHAWLLPLSHPDGPWSGMWRSILTTVMDWVRRSSAPIVNQNLGFDLRWLHAHTGIDLTGQFAWDTQISSHLLDENASTKLKERAPATFGVERWDDFDFTRPGEAERAPLFELGTYAARDTYWTWRLAVLHRTMMNVAPYDDPDAMPVGSDEWEQFRLGQLARWCAMPTGASLARISQTGFPLDMEWVHQRIATEADREQAAYDLLVNRYPAVHQWNKDMHGGEPSFAPTSRWFKMWAEEAVTAGDLKITAYTENGNPQWSKAVLVRQSRARQSDGVDPENNVPALLLALREASKLQQFLRSWSDLVSPQGTIHSTYHAGRVVTGRLSSSDPNMQQVTKVLKPAYVPRPGHYVAELDYSQIELRMAAFISRCQPMLDAFNRGDDLHRLLAARITGKAPEDVTPADRQAGKSANFGLLYGMGVEGFREYAETTYGVSFTSDEAAAVHEAFFDQWEGMHGWHLKQQAEARATGQVVSPIGRVRRLPDVHSGNDRLRSHAERNAINSPVQGFGSDLMQIAAASISGLLPGTEAVPDVRIIATVHDSIVVEVPEDGWQRAVARCMRRMIDVDGVLRRMGCRLDVPLAVEATVGTRWGLGDVGVVES